MPRLKTNQRATAAQRFARTSLSFIFGVQCLQWTCCCGLFYRFWDYAKEEALCVTLTNYEITSNTESTRPSIRFLRWHLFPLLLLLHLFSNLYTSMYASASRPEKFCASFRDSVLNELPIDM